MIIKDLKELKEYLRSVMLKFNIAETCMICNTLGRDVAFNNPRLIYESCCVGIDCDYKRAGVDCVADIKLKCLFYICENLMIKHPQLSNYLNKIRSSISKPYKLVFPLEIERFK